MNHSKKDQDFRNYIDYPYNNAIRKGNRPPRPRPKYPFNASGYNMCCGLAATGDGTEEAAPVPVIAAAKVQSVNTWAIVRTALALVGLYAVGMYLWKIQK